MKEISSSENRIFKHALSLRKKKYRDESGEYLIEGPNLVKEALKCGAEIVTVFTDMHFDLREIAEIPKEEIFVLSDSLFGRLTETETPQGVIAVVKKAGEPFRFSRDCGDSGGNFVVLDRLQDPGNIGTILRTADAAGYELAIFLKGTADPYGAKVVRSAAGSLFRVPMVFLEGPDELADFVHSRGKKLIATAMDAETDYFRCDLKRNCAVVIGNEGNGISPELLKIADMKIRIPMQGNIESLNASVAAGILMYERIREE